MSVETYTQQTTLDHYHPLMSTPVRMKDGSTLAADLLARRLYESRYGGYMETQPYRFSQRFGYDRPTMLADLGDDIHPIGHQKESGYHLALLLSTEENAGVPLDLSEEDTGTLMLACQIHDMGESMHPDIVEAVGAVVGDIPAGGKTPQDRATEKAIRLFLYDELLDDVDPSVIERIEAIIAHEDDSLLHELSEVTHTIQTFDTAVHAYEQWRTLMSHHHGDVMDIQSYDGGRSSAILGLHRSVLLNNHKVLRHDAKTYSYVAQYIAPYEDLLQGVADFTEEV